MSVGASPSVSPDGRYLAYSTSYSPGVRCLSFDSLVVRNLATGKEQYAQLGGRFAVGPETWWPDSRHLAAAVGPFWETVTVESHGLRDVGQVPLLGNGYVFLPDGEPITAVPGATTTRIVTFDPSTGNPGPTIAEFDQPLVLLSVDASGSSFLLGGPLGDSSNGPNLYRAHIGDPHPVKLASLGLAAWLPRSTPVLAGPRPFVDAKNRLSVTLPKGWTRARRPLVPYVSDPHEVLAVATVAPVVPTRHSPLCDDQGPTDTLSALGRGDAFVWVVESDVTGRFQYPSGPIRPSQYPPRPPSFARAAFRPDLCPPLTRLRGHLTTRIADVVDAGRVIGVYVTWGDRVTARRRAETWQLLNSLQLRPTQPTTSG